MISKEEARAKAAAIRRTISKEYIAGASNKIASAFLDSDEYKEAGTVLAYLHYGKEPRTDEIISAMLGNGKRVCIPLCTDCDAHIMEAKLYTYETKLVEGAYGIMEPSGEAPTVEPAEIDCVIVPCVACDSNRNRLGHGAGYYDRYLAQTEATRVCLCLEDLILDEVPTDRYDLPVDRVITEKHIY